jgi:hypothetical protein
MGYPIISRKVFYGAEHRNICSKLEILIQGAEHRNITKI